MADEGVHRATIPIEYRSDRSATRKDDRGMATVEYAMVTVAAAAFAGVLVVLIRSDEVRELLLGVIRSAFGG